MKLCSPGFRGGAFVALALALTAAPAYAETWAFVQQGATLSYFKGYQLPASGWTGPGFQQGAGWIDSATGFGIGYGDADDATVLQDMAGSYLTVYVRAHFHVGAELSAIKTLTLDAMYDDGFIAYLNGVEIGRASMPPGPATPATAATDHEATLGPAHFVVPANLLVPGDNVFAAEVHNASLGSSDLSFEPVLIATDGAPPVDAQLTRGPYLQQVGRNSALIVWYTDKPAPSRVRFGPTPALGHAVVDPQPVLRHLVKLDALASASEHFYDIESASVPSPLGRFRTEGDLASPVRIGVFGDTRSNHVAHGQVVAALHAEQPELAMHVGDQVADGSLDTQWDTFFQVEKGMLRDVPLYPVRGNHEGTGQNFADIFELPTISPERYYLVKRGPIAIWALDQYTVGYGQGSAQLDWLSVTMAEADADPSIRHKLVVLHHGPFDSASHLSNLTVRDNLVPIFKKYCVEVVFAGHDHDYERGTVDGIKYVVTGGGGAPLYSVPGDWWTEVKASLYEYCVVDAHGPSMKVTCKDTDGAIVDQFMVGEPANECSVAADCASSQHGTCPPGEVGAWVCVQKACIWNCSTPAPQPDAGPDAHPDAPHDAGTHQDAAHDSAHPTDAGLESGAAAVWAPEQDGGCGCRAVARGSGSGWLLLGLAALTSRRRRSRARRRPCP